MEVFKIWSFITDLVVFKLFSPREARAVGLAQLVRVNKISTTASETGNVKRISATRSESDQLLFIVELKRFFTKFIVLDLVFLKL